jgi:hypothetical protein
MSMVSWSVPSASLPVLAVPRGFQPAHRVDWLSLGSEMEASHQVPQAVSLHALNLFATIEFT